MWLKREVYEHLVSRAAQSESLAKAEARAEKAEASLVKERADRISEVRHVFSMFLRHERTYPLPASTDEKAEQKAEVEAKKNQPIELNADQIARRQAVRDWAKTQGLSQEDADKSFMSQLALQADDE